MGLPQVSTLRSLNPELCIILLLMTFDMLAEVPYSICCQLDLHLCPILRTMSRARILRTGDNQYISTFWEEVMLKSGWVSSGSGICCCCYYAHGSWDMLFTFALRNWET